MNEEKKAERAIEKKAAEDIGDGNKPKASSVIEQANEAADRLERANQKREELLKKEEALLAKRVLGGKSEGKEEEKPKEETPQEYKDKVLRGEI